MSRPASAAALALLAAALLAVSATRWIDLTGGGLLPALQALGPYACVAAAVAAVVALALHPGGTAQRLVGVLVVADLLTVLVFARTPGADHAGDAGDGGASARTMTVVSANTGMGKGDPAQLLREATEVGADVLVLLEADRWFVKALDAAGGQERFPHRVVSDDDAPAATAVLTREPFEQVAAPGLTFASVALRVAPGLTVRGVHAAPPLAGLAADWRDDLARIDAWSRTVDGPLVVAGDFNASASHPGFRELCHGSGGLHGCGGVFARPTWAPVRWPFDLLPLDHVLVHEAAVAERGSFEVEGSDHRAVWARVVAD